MEAAISAARGGKLFDRGLASHILRIDEELRLRHLGMVDVFDLMVSRAQR